MNKGSHGNKKVETVIEEISKGINIEDPVPLELNKKVLKNRGLQSQYMHWFSKYFHNKKTVLAVMDGSRMGSTLVQLVTLIKLGWRAGKSTNEVMQDLDISNPHRRKIFNSVISAIKEEMDQIDPSSIYTEYTERKRGHIAKLQKVCERIEDYWNRNKNDNRFMKEYLGYVAKISEFDDMVIKMGYELGIFGRKDEDKQIIIGGLDNLLPEDAPEEIEHKPELEDLSGENSTD